jgi:L-fuconolactonase
MDLIDAHQHFWNLERVAYPWLNPSHGILNKTYAPADLEPHLTAAGIAGTVLVQAVNGFEDTRAMLEIADQTPWVKAVVGWIPLTEPKIAEVALEVLVENSKFRGVRHLVHDEPDADYLLKPSVLETLNILASRGLSFDLVGVLPRHLEVATVIAAQIPNLKLVIDHLCKPPIRAKGWQPWAGLLKRASEFSNVYAKISGLNTAADWRTWTADDLEPYVNHALESFGAERLMFGSDYPVALLAGDYAKVWHETNVLLKKLTPEQKAQILGGAAARFYRFRLH